jgi:ABC-type dipeptide/oligopeptide/nickel transport system ATPase component
MRQRVMIAIAMVCKPKLLIADEPTSALDVIIQSQILDLMKRLQSEAGTGIVIITHDFGVVAEIADRAAVMYAGKIVEIGVVRDIFHNPQHTYTRSLLTAWLGMRTWM